MRNDGELDYACAKFLMAPEMALMQVANSLQLHMLQSDLHMAKQDAQAAKIDATHWRLRCQYAERRLSELTKGD